MTTKNQTGGDLVIHVESEVYCMKSSIVRNQTGTAVDLDSVVGYPVIAGTSGADYNLMSSGGESNVLGLIVDGPVPLTLADGANSTDKYKVLIHAPAVVNENMLATVDNDGDNFIQATLITALKALGFETSDIPAKQTIQTT